MERAAETITLRDYMDTRFKAMETALTVALAALNDRLEGMNEFRAAMSDQTRNTVQRPEYERLLQDVQELREFRARLGGAASQKQVTTATMIALAGLMLGAAGLIVNILARS